MNEIQNAYLWNDYLMEGGALSGASMQGTAGGPSAAVPKPTVQAILNSIQAGRGGGTKAGTGPISAVTYAQQQAAQSGATVPSIETGAPAKKKIFFDVISKPVAIGGGALLLLGAFLLLKRAGKHKPAPQPQYKQLTR